MRYFVKARLKPNKRDALLDAIKNKTLGFGSVAGGEYLRDMAHARQLEDGTVCWVEVCYCPTPLEEERPYWEAYFELLKIKDAHARSRCKDETGEQYWACSSCDCTQRLEEKMEGWGDLFIHQLTDDTENYQE